MADLRISDLPAATTPLAGSELLALVQSGTTKRVTVAQLGASLTSLGTLTSLRMGGTLDFATDATYNIGASGANRPNNIYAAGSGVFGSNVGVGTTPVYPLHILRSTAGVGAQIENSTTYAQLRLKSSGTNQGAYLTFNTTGTGSAIIQVNDTDRATLDASGNLGLGVTPSAWGLGKAFEIGVAGNAIWGVQTADLRLFANCYYDGSTYRYANTGSPAARYDVNNGTLGGHAWYTAASGTAGTAITFTQAMTLEASGRLNLTPGASTPNVFRIESTNTYMDVVDTGLATVRTQSTGGVGLFGTVGLHPLALMSNNTQRWQVNSAGHFIAYLDATYDIGASGANRPNNVYAAANGVFGGYLRVSAASAGAASTTTIGSTTATTVGAAGGASALPATPLGYIIAHVGTTQVKIPYFNA